MLGGYPELNRLSRKIAPGVYETAVVNAFRASRYRPQLLALLAIAVFILSTWVMLELYPTNFTRNTILVLFPFLSATGFLIGRRILQSRIRREVRRLMNELGHPTCLECAYDLTGNESDQCPECGQPCTVPTEPL